MYTVDGLTPDGDGWELHMTGTGLRGVAGRRNAMLELPGVNGVLPDLRAPFTQGTLPLRYRIMTDSHLKAMQVIEKFNGVFGQRKLLPVTHTYAPGTTRVNEATVVEATPPEVVNVDLAYYMVTLQFPNPFWRGTSTVTAATPALTSSLAVYALQDFTGTAPITDALIRFKGAFSTARVIDAITGDQIDITAPLTASEYAVVDTANWTARKVTTDAWAGGTDFTQYVQTNKGRGHMFAMEPDQILTGGRYRVRVLATNPASSPTVEVRARMSYH